ncbi:OB-fold domain-containing protein [Cryptosporangium sp. NPDC051539]|uniref:OB-fold domain-containing protein n=1 Tax=Cryptosporangium sp. NPDC051539 TaxID=3363962 RepID=UPI00378DB4A7
MADSIGVSDYGVYIPYWRLEHAAIGAATGTRAGKGTRAVAGYDEDTTTLAVEASRRALPGTTPLTGVVLATSTPVYADKTNASAVHAALGLDQAVRVADSCGGVRSGVAALLAAMYQPGATLVALSDLRTGPSGSVDEATGGDAAAAFVLGGPDVPLVAELLGAGSASREFLDRWREPGAPWSSTWEERFGEEIYLELGAAAFGDALKQAGVAVGEIAHSAVTGLSARAASKLPARLGIPADRRHDDLVSTIGNAGTAHCGVLLAALFDDAKPGDVVVLTVLADGADTLVFRMTEAHRPSVAVATEIARGTGRVGYVDFLSRRGLIERQQPRRPDPDRAVPPATNRQLEWKFSFSGSECDACCTRHLPPQRVCLRCATQDRMTRRSLAGTRATIATFTVDHLAFSPAPPLIAAALDFDGGGRYLCELTDIEASTVAVGRRVEMTFRRMSTTAGIHNYFWKARPSSEGAAS